MSGREIHSWLMDMDGVLVHEERAIPGAAEFLPLGLWANFVSWFCLANVQSLYPKLASSRGFSPQLIGCLLFMVGAAQSLFFLVTVTRP